jgi:hypothetical protein
MDGRDQPDTDVVRIRRKGDPSEAERKRLARTIFAEEDEVGPFSRGNLVPPRSDRSTQSSDAARPEPDPYFESLQRTAGGDRRGGTAAEADADSQTTAYFEQLTNCAPDEMALMIDTPSPERAMPGSAQLPAEPARPEPRRKHKRTRRTPTTGREPSAHSGPVALDPANVGLLDHRSTHMSGAGWNRSRHRATASRLVRPVILMALGLALAGGAAFAAIVAEREPPRLRTTNARTSA